MSAGQTIDIRQMIGDEHSLATDITQLWTSWDSARNVWKERIKETKSYVFATSTRETTNAANPWSHSTNIPKITQVYDNLKANYMSGLFPNEDWFTFSGEDYEGVNAQRRDQIVAYLKTKHRVSGFREEAEKMMDDWLLTGNCFGLVTYVSETTEDPDTGLPINGYTGPKVYRISPLDIVFNPIATDFEHSPKIIRSIKSLGEIQRDIEENPELQYEQEIFSRALDDRLRLREFSAEEVDKNYHLAYEGFGTFGSYIKSGYVEILDFYGDLFDTETNTLYKNHVITVIDRRYVIRKQPLNTWTGRPHIYHTGWRQRPDNLWAMGPLDNLVGMQYRINHLENARADAFDQFIAPDYVFVGDVETYPGENGSTIYEANEGGSVSHLAPDTTVLQADFQIATLMDMMELAAGAPREAMGVRTPGEKTAFEVSELMTAAGRVFQSKLSHFERSLLEPLLNAEIEVGRRNLATTDIVKMVDNDTGVAEFLTITKDDITANGKLVAEGARHYARRAQLTQELTQFSQLALADPMVAQHFPSIRLGEMWEELLGFHKFKLFEPYARIQEQLEAQRLMNIANQQATEEQMIAAESEF